MSDGVWAGVDIGGTKTAVVVASTPPEVLGRIEFPTRPAEGPGPAIDLIIEKTRELVGNRPLLGIGVSCGGPLNSTAGRIQAPPNLWTWVDVPINRILTEQFAAPCHLENDANAGAVAEYRYGAGRGTRNMIFLTMGTGLGAGLILDGRLYRGTSDAAGEIGHVRLTRKGPVGYHKAGSVEGWASGGGLGRVATAAVKSASVRGEKTLLADHESVNAKQVAEAAKQGDAFARKLIRSTGRRLGESLAILVDLFNPESIVIGGLAMRLGDDLWKPALDVLRREALPGSTAVCSVVPAQLQERIGDLAALCVATGV